MFDTQARESARFPPAVPPVQFISIEVLPTADEMLCISVTSTSVDEERLEFINHDLEVVRARTVDEALAAIRRSIVEALGFDITKEEH